MRRIHLLFSARGMNQAEIEELVKKLDEELQQVKERLVNLEEFLYERTG
jgi:hypothetical protein